MRRRYALVGLVTLLLGFGWFTSGNRVLPVAVEADPLMYRLELTIYTDKDPYLLEVEIGPREFRAIESDPTNGIQPFVLQARHECAEKAGYRKEIYGEENYKMVAVRKYTFVIRDLSQGRVVLKK